jgi:hypothetical protein
VVVLVLVVAVPPMGVSAALVVSLRLFEIRTTTKGDHVAALTPTDHHVPHRTEPHLESQNFCGSY